MRTLAVLFAFLILLPSLVKVVIVGNYLVQYERYATELCENQDKPELACNGKCQMMKELNESEQNAPVAPSLPEFKVKEQPVCELSSALLVSFSVEWKQEQSLSTFKGLSEGIFGNVFHPPCCL